MKKILILLLAIITIFTLSSWDNNVVGAEEGPEPIAVKVDLNNFDESNTGTDNQETLLWKRGDAFTTDGVIRIAPNVGEGTAGTVVRRNQIKLKNGFSTYFKTKIHNPGPNWGHWGGDGMAFVIYESPEILIGGYGGSL